MANWWRREVEAALARGEDHIVVQRPMVETTPADTYPAPTIEYEGWLYRGAQVRPSMGPRAASLCRRCWERPCAAHIFDLTHIKYRFLCAQCRQIVTHDADLFARTLKIPLHVLLNIALQAVSWED